MENPERQIEEAEVEGQRARHSQTRRARPDGSASRPISHHPGMIRRRAWKAVPFWIWLPFSKEGLLIRDGGIRKRESPGGGECISRLQAARATAEAALAAARGQLAAAADKRVMKRLQFCRRDADEVV